MLCNNATLLPPKRNGERWGIIGDPTEAALLVMAAKGGVNIEARRNALPGIGQLPFEAVRKRMTSINLSDEEQPVAHVKGSPKEILNLCTSIFMNGKVQSLTDSEREVIVSRNDFMAKEGLRVLGFAYRPLDFSEGFTIKNTENDLIFLGLAGMMDPKAGSAKGHRIMSQGRNKSRYDYRRLWPYSPFGRKKIGLVKTEHPKVITGLELTEMDNGALEKLLKEEEVIFARVSPEHKMRIVTAFKDMNEVVAVTGDGVNDAPALKKADIGVAMGIRGSDVAKEAAAMILTDDNFASIVAAIEEGRAVFSNIKKFVTYIFASNIPEIVPFIAFVLFKIPLPLTVMQILAVDLGTDMVPRSCIRGRTARTGNYG